MQMIAFSIFLFTVWLTLLPGLATRHHVFPITTWWRVYHCLRCFVLCFLNSRLFIVGFLVFYYDYNATVMHHKLIDRKIPSQFLMTDWMAFVLAKKQSFVVATVCCHDLNGRDNPFTGVKTNWTANFAVLLLAVAFISENVLSCWFWGDVHYWCHRLLLRPEW